MDTLARTMSFAIVVGLVWANPVLADDGTSPLGGLKKGTCCLEPEGIPVDLNRDSPFYRNPFAHPYYRQWLQQRVRQHVVPDAVPNWRVPKAATAQPTIANAAMEHLQASQAQHLAGTVASGGPAVPASPTPTGLVAVPMSASSTAVAQPRRLQRRGFALRGDRVRSTDVDYLSALRRQWEKVQDQPRAVPRAVHPASSARESSALAESVDKEAAQRDRHATLVGYVKTSSTDSASTHATHVAASTPSPSPASSIPKPPHVTLATLQAADDLSRSMPAPQSQPSVASQPKSTKSTQATGERSAKDASRQPATKSLSEMYYRGMGWQSLTSER